MKINSIKIENLFEIFNYDISFKPEENVLIITGPNGFGKTMILNIIFNLFNRKFIFFQKLVFEKIILCLDEKIKIIILKTIEDDKPKISFSFIENEIEIEKFDYTHVHLESDLARNREFFPVFRTTSNTWRDNESNRRLTNNDVLNEYADLLPEMRGSALQIKSEKVKTILDSIQVHLIKEQRLFKKAQNIKRNYSEERVQTVMIKTIQTYSKELKELILEFLQKSFIQTQELDSSYPQRLTNENNILTRNEYRQRYNKIKNKQTKLTEFGLYESKQELITYNDADAKALSVYLKDFEQKLGVFDELLDKLELFTSILNERRFTFKSININRAKGFYFKTNKGNELELSQLSSGEQHEVVLLYELIFNVKPDVLVLIDEPEISLHITWQKEFLKDLIKIIEIQKIQVIIATHSPSIINDRWDLVYNLETDK